MEKLLSELKGLVNFKDTIDIGDIVLVVAKEPQMLVYALVAGIERDTGRNDEWWNLEFCFLSVPLQRVVWTLRMDQMTGMEIFTMGGEERFVKAVDFGVFAPKPEPSLKTVEVENVKKKGPALKRIK